MNNTFLQDTLTDEFYVTQPPGFVDPDPLHHVCKLNKDLYGLKHAPRDWYEELKSYLIKAGFSNSISDTSLFTYIRGKDICYVLVYVDDIVVTRSTDTLVTRVISELARSFSIKDLGHLSYFLGKLAQWLDCI